MLYLGTATVARPARVDLALRRPVRAPGIVVLGYHRLGRALYAIGGNVDAARAAGIRTDRVIWVVFIVGGLLAALGGPADDRPARLGRRQPRATA